MIVREKPTFWEVLYLSHVVQRILPQMASVFCLSLLVATLHRRGWTEIPNVPTVGLSVIGAALSILAAFRNSASYERWLEARRVTGQVVVHLRSLSRQARCYITKTGDDDLERRISLRCVAFMQVVRDLLRDRPLGGDVVRYLSPEENTALPSRCNRPNYLLAQFSADIAEAIAAGRLSQQMAQLLEQHVSDLTLAYGALERTKTTPIPFIYTLALRRLTYIFCFLVPFGLHDVANLWTPLLAVIICYIFFGLDVLAGYGSAFQRHVHGDSTRCGDTRDGDIHSGYLGRKEFAGADPAEQLRPHVSRHSMRFDRFSTCGGRLQPLHSGQLGK
jgi:ion channel-forming bestrophin family protein